MPTLKGYTPNYIIIEVFMQPRAVPVGQSGHHHRNHLGSVPVVVEGNHHHHHKDEVSILETICVCLYYACVGLANLFSFASHFARKTMPQGRINCAVNKIESMQPHDFTILSSHITSQYQEGCTTSHSSSKMIRRLRGDNIPHKNPNITQNPQVDLAHYLQKSKNNGKKLFCKIVDLVETHPDASGSMNINSSRR